ncbi:MAG: 50S ribosomal protein L19e [Nanoarchaeota archaeon]|nr:50S ribosomal protein L19e [Nanoarchaeota archaeon]MCG2718476.1 50S ribosomal protein L19e [Nanoarchaeota archaeon]
MRLKSQRRIAAQILKVGENRIWFDGDRLEEVKEAITKIDIKKLIKDLAIQSKPETNISGYRRRKKYLQKRKGRQKGQGSRKGTANARKPKKESWMIKIRLQRGLLKKLRDNKTLEPEEYRNLYKKAKGGFFRNKRHVLLYLEEKGVFKKQENKKVPKKEKK